MTTIEYTIVNKQTASKARNLMHIKNTENVCVYGLKRVQIRFKNVHLFFVYTKCLFLLNHINTIGGCWNRRIFMVIVKSAKM